MALQANYEFLFVGKDDLSFLENYYYDLFEEHGLKSGQIFVNLEVQNNPAYAEELGGVIFQRMIDYFFVNFEADPYDRFEAALREVNKAINVFKEERGLEFLGTVNAIVAAVVEGRLLLTQTGDAEAYLVRKKCVSIVSDGLSDPDQVDLFASIASGEIESGDFVLFSSSRLLRYVGKSDLASCLHKNSVAESLDDLRDLIYTEILGRVGLTGMLFSKMSVAEIDAVSKQVDEVNKGVMQASDTHVSARKETLVGKFFSFANRVKNRTKSSGVGDSISRFASAAKDKIGVGNRSRLIGAFVFLVVFLIVASMFIGGNRAEKEKLEQLSVVLESVEENVNLAKTKGEYDKAEAMALLDKAYADAKSVMDSGEFREKSSLLMREIDITRDRLENIERLENPTVFLDLVEADPAINALGFVDLADKLYVYSAEKLYEIVVDKVIEPIAIDDEEKVIAATGFDSRQSLIFLTQLGKIIEFKDGTMNFVDAAENGFKKGVAVDDWSGNLYILENEEGQIWKYAFNGANNSFNAGVAYLSAPNEKLVDGGDLTIDGSIYSVAGDQLIKMYSGQIQDFFVNDGPEDLFRTPNKVFTSDKLSSVFVLDTAEKRVLILDKSTNGNLVYRSQYVLDVSGSLRDIYADVKSSKLYVLSDNKVYEIAF